MDNYEQLTGILRVFFFYRLLRVYYGMLLFIEAYTCKLRPVSLLLHYEQLRISYKYLRVLRFFAKNYINRSSSCSFNIVRSTISGDRGDYAAQF